MRINPDISDMTIGVKASDMAKILALASNYDRLRQQLVTTEAKNSRMRVELAKYQAICERRKRNSGAGASVEPQKKTKEADENKTAAVVLAIETEGRVSGGERADNDIGGGQ